MADPKTFTDFEHPPVIEVVCGVLFKPLEALLAPHLGILWQKFKDEYPTCQEQPPLASVIERFDESPSVQIEFTDRPPLPRTWLIHRDENGIVQVQRDRFLHNWRKVRPDDEYPHYDSVIAMFRERLASFKAFVSETKLGSLQPLQYEMTYVNHIPRGDGYDSLATVGNVFPDFAWRTQSSRFLPEPEALNWRTSFLLPKQAGRLHATIRSATRRDDKTPILMLDLTARGMGDDSTRASMWAWFDLAHEWIVEGFADLTGETMHKTVWNRTR